jgi:hypothetical protein
MFNFYLYQSGNPEQWVLLNDAVDVSSFVWNVNVTGIFKLRVGNGKHEALPTIVQRC